MPCSVFGWFYFIPDGFGSFKNCPVFGWFPFITWRFSFPIIFDHLLFIFGNFLSFSFIFGNLRSFSFIIFRFQTGSYWIMNRSVLGWWFLSFRMISKDVIITRVIQGTEPYWSFHFRDSRQATPKEDEGPREAGAEWIFQLAVEPFHKTIWPRVMGSRGRLGDAKVVADIWATRSTLEADRAGRLG